MVSIRTYTSQDWDEMWAFMEPVFRAGETYPYPVDITEQEALERWIKKPAATYVAVDEEGALAGTYYIKPNQPGLGSHVCNCGYIVAHEARGQGIGSRMCAHSQREAVSMGFRAMQYNLVVANNEPAVHLWEKHGFQIIGTLPGAFHHQRLGYIDAHVMYKELAV